MRADLSSAYTSGVTRVSRSREHQSQLSGQSGQCESWKHFTARKINRAVGRFGRFWEQDAFDHLARSPGGYERLRRYIADNPAAAGLSPGEYLYYTEDRRGRVVLVTLRRDVVSAKAEDRPHGGA